MRENTIPQFPEFTNVTPKLKTEIESFTHKHEPYSDLNFHSLYSWDTLNERKVSQLNGNLVVKMTDYETGEPLLTYLGTNDQENSIKTLIEFARKHGISDTLHFVPKVSISNVTDPSIIINENRGDFDYIFSVTEIAELKGGKYSKKRQLTNAFRKQYPQALFYQERMSNTSNESDIIRILNNWQQNKINSDKECDLNHEPVAINRLLKMEDKSNLLLSYILNDDETIAFSIDEILPNKFAIAHYSKFDTSYKGINEFLNHNIAIELRSKDVEQWNWEQDLDIDNLRYSKMSYLPVRFIEKYRVEIN